MSAAKRGTGVVIVGAKRTCIGSFMGCHKDTGVAQLGATAAKGAIAQAGISPEDVEEVVMGCVIQAGVGQAPARQVALGAKMGLNTPSTTINKVCASGMKSVMMAAQGVQAGDRKIMLAGGMENMSQIPHYMNLRVPTGFGDAKAVDGIQHDGLTDAYSKELMGKCTEGVVQRMGITREMQDAFAIGSYEKSRLAQKNGIFSSEIVGVEVVDRKGKTTTFLEDEECKKFFPEKFPSLRPAFDKDGSITAANSSKINDGAGAMVLMCEEEALARGLKPLARIIGYDDAAVEPADFAIAPADACKRLFAKTGIAPSDIDFHEINEAFSAVALANMQLLDIDASKVNVHGGAVSLGHPIGCSGSRILISLMNVLSRQNGTLGMASICNGGGGASAIILERMN